METVNFLAQLWGFSLVIICFSFLIKPKHVTNLFSHIERETTLLGWGIVAVVLGVASVLSYNVWENVGWQKIITIFGWLMIIKGATYLLMPEKVVKWTAKLKTQYASWISNILVVGVLLGCWLVYLGQNY